MPLMLATSETQLSLYSAKALAKDFRAFFNCHSELLKFN